MGQPGTGPDPPNLIVRDFLALWARDGRFESRKKRHRHLAKQYYARQDEPPPPSDTASSISESVTISSSTVSSSSTISSSTISSSTVSSSTVSSSTVSSSTVSSSTVSSSVSSSTVTSSTVSSSSVSSSTQSSSRSTSLSTSEFPTTRRSSSLSSTFSPSSRSQVSSSHYQSSTSVSSFTTTSSDAAQNTPPPVTSHTTTTQPTSTFTGVVNPPERNNSFGTNRAGIIGVTVGSGLFLLLMALLVFFLCKRYRRRRVVAALPSSTEARSRNGHRSVNLDDEPYRDILAAMDRPSGDDTGSGEGEMSGESLGHSSSSDHASRTFIPAQQGIEGTLLQGSGAAAVGWLSRSASPKQSTKRGSSQGHSSSSHGETSSKSLLQRSSPYTTPSSGEASTGGASNASNPYFTSPPSSYRGAPPSAAPAPPVPPRAITIKLPPDPKSPIYAQSSPYPPVPGSPTSIYSSPSSLLNPPPADSMTMAYPTSRPVSISIPQGYEHPVYGMLDPRGPPPQIIDPSPALTEGGDYIPEGLLHPALSAGHPRSPDRDSESLDFQSSHGHSSETSGLGPPKRPGFGMAGIQGSKRSFYDEIDYSRPLGGNKKWLTSESQVDVGQPLNEGDEDRARAEAEDYIDEHDEETKIPYHQTRQPSPPPTSNPNPPASAHTRISSPETHPTP